MNKTRKNKYLRKNRRISKKNKNKNKKTRKVQRGGEPGNTAVDAGVNPLPIGTGEAILKPEISVSSLTVEEKNVQPVEPLSKDELRKKLQALSAKQKAEAKAEAEASPEKVAAKAEAQAAEAKQAVTSQAVTSQASPLGNFKLQQQARPLGNFKLQKSTGFDFGEPIQPSAQPQPAAAAEAAAKEEAAAPATAPAPTAAAAAAEAEAMDAFYGQPYNRSIMNPISFAAPPPAAVTTTTEIKPTNKSQSETNEARVAQLQKEANEKKKMTERADPRFSLLANTFPNWIMGKFSSIGRDSQVKLGEEIILTDFLNNIGNHIKKTKNQIEEVEYFNDLLLKAIQELNKTNDMTPDNLDKFNLYIKQIDYNNMFINKTLSDMRTTYEGAIKSGVLQPMPEKPSSPGFFDKIKNTLKGNQKVLNEQNETPGNEKPSFTQRVKKGVSNMGKTVKKAATSAKGAIMRMTKKNNNKVGPEIDMQEVPQNPGNNVSPPPVPPRPESFPSSVSSSSSESALSQQSTVGNNGSPTSTYVKTISLPPKLQSVTRPDGPPNKSLPPLPPLPSLKQPPPETPPDMIDLKDYQGGGKTRKNQQYIHEVKQNRTHLFNKEMEIINSIRNFKHGHIDNDNTKKQFMKAVKRG